MLIWSTGFWISTDQTSIRTPLIYYWGQGCGGGWQLVELGLKRKCMKLYSQSWIRFLAINPLQLRSAQIQPLSNFSHELSLFKKWRLPRVSSCSLDLLWGGVVRKKDWKHNPAAWLVLLFSSLAECSSSSQPRDGRDAPWWWHARGPNATCLFPGQSINYARIVCNCWECPSTLAPLFDISADISCQLLFHIKI